MDKNPFKPAFLRRKIGAGVALVADACRGESRAMIRWLAILLCCGAVAFAARPLTEAMVTEVRHEAAHLAEDRRWPQALAAGERALDACRTFFGEEHAATARAELFLAETHQRAGDAAAAEKHFRRALAVQEKALAPADPALVVTLTQLAALLKNQQRYADAAPLLERALELQRTALGLDHADIAVTLRNLAVLHRLAGAHERAVPLLEEALEIRERALGASAPETLASLAELADLHRLRGASEAAEPLLQARRERIEQRYGAESLAAAEAWQALALHYEAAQHWPAAIEAASRSFDLHERQLDRGDPRVIGELFIFARICAAAGEFAQAREYYARLAPWFAEHPEADPRTRSEWQRQFALATLRSGRTADAERLFLESRRWHEAQCGRNDPATLRALGDLWTFYAENGQPAEALEPAREVAARSTESLGSDAPATLLVGERLAQLYTALGQRDEALACFRAALEGSRRRFGPEARETLATLARLAAWHESAGEHAAAAALQRERLAGLERTAGMESEAAALRSDLARRLFRATAPGTGEARR